MKFQSVSIEVGGMKNIYYQTGWRDRGDKYFYDTINEVRSFDYGLTLNSLETVNIVNVDGVYSYSAQTSDGYTRRLSFILNKDINLIDTLWSQIYREYSYKTGPHSGSSGSDNSFITLVNLPYTIGVNGEIIVELFPPFANNISMKYWHHERSGTIDPSGYYGGSRSYQGETKEFLGFADSAYIKIVLTPAK